MKGPEHIKVYKKQSRNATVFSAMTHLRCDELRSTEDEGCMDEMDTPLQNDHDRRFLLAVVVEDVVLLLVFLAAARRRSSSSSSACRRAFFRFSHVSV